MLLALSRRHIAAETSGVRTVAARMTAISRLASEMTVCPRTTFARMAIRSSARIQHDRAQGFGSQPDLRLWMGCGALSGIEPWDQPCPMKKGDQHMVHLFHNGRGMSCWRCHKTWGFEGDVLVPTFSAPSPTARPSNPREIECE